MSTAQFNVQYINNDYGMVYCEIGIIIIIITFLWFGLCASNEQYHIASYIIYRSNYIFIRDLTPDFNGLGKGNSTTRRETFKFGDLLQRVLEVWPYICVTELGHHWLYNSLSPPVRCQAIIGRLM